MSSIELEIEVRMSDKYLMRCAKFEIQLRIFSFLINYIHQCEYQSQSQCQLMGLVAVLSFLLANIGLSSFSSSDQVSIINIRALNGASQDWTGPSEGPY